ncbi:hypothetical protein COR50_10940 [Chitinophaga caeni]|uniref:N-acetyltransferase domain-containing protein n=1 Tax=Chitinophaga caeni TaxID=2029983 RepID=A0A291QUD2_9BACT|nr:GNAT family N-acetyltransferase [Chitinophaga caeni]ATL47639.1 hypothetical protein COR50_10940 [Chitinophaga caeni]
MYIRKATQRDLGAIISLCQETILKVNIKDYSAEQVKIWSESTGDEQKMANRIGKQFFFVAEGDNELIGVASIDMKGCIDLMYTACHHQGESVATQLLEKLIGIAKKLALKSVTADVSLTAKGFFEKNEFKILQEQEVKLNGMTYRNLKMEKLI